ncbi:MAG: hypothetical protein EXR39_16435 [Betaproteobacteria bacterium]|nr:hypothetical protein [Betaproteobacteria bacterium]
MKHITKCPECSTAFRVHENQLTARQGKVRCGACGHVFDAFESLLESAQDDGPAPTPPAASAVAANNPSALPPALADTSSAHLSIGAATVWPNTTNARKPDKTKPGAPSKPVQPVTPPSVETKNALAVERRRRAARESL